ncbi:MAG: hypothetical protein MRZ79_04960 [Bacteroidia bacterium]|nr:hypothetical protein [Bacteroidia bacterium]
MFSELLLRQLSEPEVFRRGMNYYREGRLRKLIKIEQVYQAEILGSQNYFTQILFEGGEFQGYCTCPYSENKWCKHLVATALGINDEAYEEIPNQSIALEPLSGFMSKYVKTAEKFHLFGFVEQMMAKNPHLQAEFLRYQRSWPGPLVDIPTLSTKWLEIIENEELEFEHEIDIHCSLPLMEAIEFGRYDTAGQYWLTAYETYLKAGSNKSRLRAEGLGSLMATQLEDVLREAISPTSVSKRLIELLFFRWGYWQQHGPPYYQWSQVAWLLELLCADMVTAQFTKHKLEAFGLDDPFLIPVKEKIEEILG